MENKIKKILSHFLLVDQDNSNFYLKAKTGPSKVTKIPKKLNQKICLYIGIIIGDGHL